MAGKEEEKQQSSNATYAVATNWIVAQGSLQNTVSFESPISPIEEDEETASRSRAALVLKPPSSDSGPCEINVSFNQKHEVHQVYVRSTSRVYEIYYALEQQRDNEYLCTVRCGVAAREDGVLQTGDIGEATAEDHDASSRKTLGVPNQTGKSASVNSSSSDEDGWVEIKVPDSPLLDTTKPKGEKINQNSDVQVQDYYEATAQITDSYPCASLTLRLLSLQVKGCVFIDEIYIFAEPVESTDAGHSLVPMESSAGSNLLAMFVPSLLQLSKSGSSRVQDRRISDIREGQKLPGYESKPTELISPELQKTVDQETPINMVDPREVKIKESGEYRTEPRKFEAILHSPHSTNVPKHDEGNILPTGHLEKMLGQLDSRMARIETFCARFEENMLKPLNSMAARMQRLEQQLDELTLRSQSPPRSNPRARITAPEFSHDESDSDTNFLHARYNDENLDSEEELEKDASFGEPSPSNVDAAVAAISPQLVPQLVVTVPEFSNDEDDSDNSDGNLESISEGISLDKPSLSIDSALASALASFISSTSTLPTKPIPSLMVKAPDFTNEDDYNDERDSLSTGVPCKGVENNDTAMNGNHGTDSMKDSDSISCGSSSQDGEVQLPNESPKEAITEGVVKRNEYYTCEVQSCTDTAAGNLKETMQTDDTNGVMFPNQPCGESLEGNSTGSSLSEIADQNETSAECADSMPDAAKVTSPNYSYADDSSTEAALEVESVQFCEEQSGDSGSTSTSTAEADTIQDDARSSDSAHSMDRLDNEPKQTSHPVLDFELPILDVKFTSEENWCPKSPLEALLGDVPETIMQLSGLEDGYKDEVADGKKDHLEFGEVQDSEVEMVNHPFFDLEDLPVESVSPCFQGEELQEPSEWGIEEPPLPSLI